MFNKFSSVFKKSVDIKAKLKDFGSSLTSVNISNAVTNSGATNGLSTSTNGSNTKEITK